MDPTGKLLLHTWLYTCLNFHNLYIQFVFLNQGDDISTHATLLPSTEWEINRWQEISSRPNVPKVYA